MVVKIPPSSPRPQWLKRSSRRRRVLQPQATITLKQIGVQLAQSHELPKRQVDALLDDVIAAVAKHIKKGAKSGSADLEFSRSRNAGANRPQSGDG